MTTTDVLESAVVDPFDPTRQDPACSTSSVRSSPALNPTPCARTPKLGVKTFTKYDKMAIVTDTSWVRHSVKAFGWLIPERSRSIPTTNSTAPASGSRPDRHGVVGLIPPFRSVRWHVTAADENDAAVCPSRRRSQRRVPRGRGRSRSTSSIRRVPVNSIDSPPPLRQDLPATTVMALLVHRTSRRTDRLRTGRPRGGTGARWLVRHHPRDCRARRHERYRCGSRVLGRARARRRCRTWIAHLYAELLGRHIVEREPLRRAEVGEAMVDGSPILFATVLPAIVLIVGRGDIVGAQGTARTGAIVVTFAQLAGIGAFVARNAQPVTAPAGSSRRPPRALASPSASRRLCSAIDGQLLRPRIEARSVTAQSRPWVRSPASRSARA